MAVWKPLRTRLSNHVVRRWIVNGRPSSADSALVSFCFDDFYHSAAQEGAALLGGLAMQATYFAAGALMGRTLDGLEHFTRNDVAELSAAGHEIGCHTFNHVRIPDCPALQIEEELARNRTFILETSAAGPPTSFAYPFGAADIRTKHLVSRQFGICRGIDKGVNSGLADFGQLRAVEITEAQTFADLCTYLDAAEATKGWLVFFTHDVSARPSEHGCRPDQLKAIAQEIRNRAIRVMPLCDAAAEFAPLGDS